jgi:formiminotetrahydrofolate cyclodeaminase
MDELIESMEVCNIYKQSSIINYILSLKIDNSIKTQLLNLIDNDNYNYNICMENDIELPPI